MKNVVANINDLYKLNFMTSIYSCTPKIYVDSHGKQAGLMTNAILIYKTN